MKKSDTNNYSAFYERVPNLLLEKIAQLNSTLAKHRNHQKSNDSLNFYEDILKTIHLAYLYTQQTAFIHQRNTILDANIQYLAHQNKILTEQITELQTVLRLKQENRLNDIIDLSEIWLDTILPKEPNNGSNGH